MSMPVALRVSTKVTVIATVTGWKRQNCDEKLNSVITWLQKFTSQRLKKGSRSTSHKISSRFCKKDQKCFWSFLQNRDEIFGSKPTIITTLNWKWPIYKTVKKLIFSELMPRYSSACGGGGRRRCAAVGWWRQIPGAPRSILARFRTWIAQNAYTMKAIHQASSWQQ